MPAALPARPRSGTHLWRLFWRTRSCWRSSTRRKMRRCGNLCRRSRSANSRRHALPVFAVRRRNTSAAWLALTEMGANGDATINTAMRTIYVDRTGPSACRQRAGESRSAAHAQWDRARLPWLDEAGVDRMESDSDYAKRIREEQTEALRWSERNSRPLHFGACEQAERIARSLFGDAVLAVSVGGFTDAIASSEQAPARRAARPISPPQRRRCRRLVEPQRVGHCP